ncbi:MAG: DUF4830 domain-containing protein [Nanobdellota archaeon]
MKLLLIALVLLVGCSQQGFTHELDALGIETTGLKEQTTVTLPETFSDANWGLKQIVCEEGGYDLEPYAGQTVTLYSYGSNHYHTDEPLDVWVIADDRVVCVYFTAEGLTPGVFSVPDII